MAGLLHKLKKASSFSTTVFESGSRIPSDLFNEAYGIYAQSFRASERWEKAELLKMLHAPPEPWGRRYFFVAQDHKTKKVLAGGVFSYLAASKSIYCSGFFVAPEGRGVGVGRSFFARAQQSIVARQPLAKQFVLFSHSAETPVSKSFLKYGSNLARAKFWERLGFGRVSIPASEQITNLSGWDLRIKGIGRGQNSVNGSVGRITLARILVDLYRNPEFGGSLTSGAFPRSFRLSRAGKRNARGTLGGASIFSKPVSEGAKPLASFKLRFGALRKPK